jgi:hypothetical protein
MPMFRVVWTVEKLLCYATELSNRLHAQNSLLGLSTDSLTAAHCFNGSASTTDTRQKILLKYASGMSKQYFVD